MGMRAKRSSGRPKNLDELQDALEDHRDAIGGLAMLGAMGGAGAYIVLSDEEEKSSKRVVKRNKD